MEAGRARKRVWRGVSLAVPVNHRDKLGTRPLSGRRVRLGTRTRSPGAARWRKKGASPRRDGCALARGGELDRSAHTLRAVGRSFQWSAQ